MSITTADAPFNDPTDNVDLVIRTADKVDFFVLSALLSLRSPSSFFRRALQRNRHIEERDGFPVLEVKEDSDTFQTILLLCYPHTDPQIESIKKLVAVRIALEKYCMDYAIGRFEQVVITSTLIKEQALQLFVLAFRKGWRQLGEAAARSTLLIPLNQEVAIEELNDISALQYVILRDYHRKCSNAAQMNLKGPEILFWMDPKDAESLKFLDPHPPLPFGFFQQCENMVEVRMRGNNGRRRVQIHSWTSDYIRAVSQKLCETPHPEIALDEKIISRAVLSSGAQCRIDNWKNTAVSEIQALAKLLSEEIDRRISEVTLDIKWTK
ncbi:hypothetical protein IW261DRAFT_1564413 [Armillaria novae-zelandiae]|uniref:BTB domain-containing protein n=1 Tax=Armillaria novae-zelandiae TaxID=153914 RepID=A0AA39UI38_9AGAR|nr:hypothetical protein IW261DRAFT_1564413 [Armillaria novae-zelandiae]